MIPNPDIKFTRVRKVKAPAKTLATFHQKRLSQHSGIHDGLQLLLLTLQLNPQLLLPLRLQVNPQLLLLLLLLQLLP